jgi:serine protease Do
MKSPKRTVSTLLLGLTAALPAGSISAPAFAQPSAPGDKEVLEKSAGAFNDVAKKATPAVVSIAAVRMVPVNPLGDLPFDVPGLPPGLQGKDGGKSPKKEKSLGIGSGVILREDGVILTNYHVVDSAEKVTVTIDEHHKYPARVIGADSHTDIALIKIIPKVSSLPTLKFGNSDEVQVGDWAVAIGNPFGLTHSVTSGIISAKGRAQMGVFDTEDFIQTDAAINPGNSGGPLLNINGEIIGINAAIFSQTGGSVGIGFAIPANLVRQVTDQILAHGHVIRGWMGVMAQNLDPGLASFFKVPEKKGALISDVDPKGPAAQSALRAGDVVIEYNHEPVTSSSDLKNLVAKTKAGSKVPVNVIRGGDRKQLAILIREQPQTPGERASQMAGQAARDEKHPPEIGLVLQDVPKEHGNPLFEGMPDKGALIVGVQPGSRAYDAGLEPGDVILKANQKSINTAHEFTQFAKTSRSSKEPLVLYVQRGPDDRLYVSLNSEPYLDEDSSSA